MKFPSNLQSQTKVKITWRLSTGQGVITYWGTNLLFNIISSCIIVLIIVRGSYRKDLLAQKSKKGKK